MTTPTMTMSDAANRLKNLAESYHGGHLGKVGPFYRGEEPTGFIVSKKELEAVTTAAAILGMFVEALEESA